MAELTEAGYQTLRDYANPNKTNPPSWDYIEIYDSSTSAITRVSVSGDPRCTWKDIDGDKTLQAEFEVTGSDSDIALPVSIEYAAIWNAASSGTQITQKEQMPSARFNQDGDNVVITHNMNIPQ
jgi:hypothetical protein